MTFQLFTTDTTLIREMGWIYDKLRDKAGDCLVVLSLYAKENEHNCTLQKQFQILYPYLSFILPLQLIWNSNLSLFAC